MVDDLALNRTEPGGDGSVRKAHYGAGEQPWDTTLACGWGPAAAGFCVLRYLRRDKAKAHSLESARWYYARLYAGADGKIASPSLAGDWIAALSRLELLLTRDELTCLRT